MTAKSSFLRSPRAWLLAAAAGAALGTAALQPALAQTADPILAAEIATTPLYEATAGDRPTMLLAPSVEFPTVGLLHNYGGSEKDTYDPAEEYLGYFNHQMCYEYDEDGGYFEIEGKGTIATKVVDGKTVEGGAKCDGDEEFSGNFLNWASASAIDMMRLALTGGDRVVDEEGLTVLQRAYIPEGTTGVESVTLMDSVTLASETKTANRGGQCFWKHDSYFYTKVLKKSDGGGDYAGAIPKKMIAALDAQDAQETGRPVNEEDAAQDAKGKLFVANIGNRIHFGAHRMDGIKEKCGYGPYNYAVGAGGKQNDFHYARKNAFWPTSSHKSCDYGKECEADDDGQRVWFGDNVAGHQWITGIVKGSFTCGGDIFKNANRHDDEGEVETSFDKTSKCYLESKDAILAGDDFFYARVKVCDDDDVRDYKDSKGADFGYCKEYGKYKKPEGVIQKYKDDLRVGIFGYAIDQTAAHDTDSYKGRFGGVLRAPMKYVGHNTYSTTGQKTVGNDREEWDPDTGILKENPEDRAEGVSGVINYFNRFGRNPKLPGNYKQYDNVAELYYEALRYLQGLPPTPAAVKELDDAMKDGFPAYTSWDGLDPFRSELGYTTTADYTCLNNSLLIIGDIYTHDAVNSSHGNEQLRATMKGENADASKNEIDLLHWRDVVRAFETGGSKDYKDGQDKERTTETPSGETTFPSGMTGVFDKTRNIWSLIPGMAYWAHTHDIRGTDWKGTNDKDTVTEKDENGKVTKSYNVKARPGLRVTSYFFDVNENGWSTRYDYRKGTVNQHGGTEWPKDGNYHWGNQYWIAAKYGGFKTQPANDDDTAYSSTGNPFYADKCTTTTDGGGKETTTCVPGTANNLVWSDLKKEQGDNTDGAANPEPRTYFMPSNARGVIAAFDEIFGATPPITQRSIGGADSAGGLGGTSYQASFNSATWSGDVIAEKVPKCLERDSTTGECTKLSDPEVKWCASNALASLGHANRTIIMGAHDATSDSANTSAFVFKADTGGEMDAVKDALLAGGCTSAEDCINWLRGDQSKEGSGLRVRGTSHKDCPQNTASVLGDIINSGMKYVGAPAGSVNLGAGYDKFVENQTTRTAAVYVGANDGMLHAFHAGGKQEVDGALKDVDGTGEELFAYIPSWMRDKLAALTDPDYIKQGSHQAYVDATPVIGDAIIKASPAGDASDWASVLVGGTGGGGKGVFALNVTDPTQFTKDSVLWEFTDADDPDMGMGYVLGQARIVKLYTGDEEDNSTTPATTKRVYRWFAMVPAGVNNYVNGDATREGYGDAYIFLLALDKPARTQWTEGSNYWKLRLPRIQALDATHPSGILNLEAFTGLGGVTEYVYAGDLHGQLWAFSFNKQVVEEDGTQKVVTKPVPSSEWTELKLSVLYNDGTKIKPLFIAKDKDGNPQPITVAPTILEGAGNGVHFVSFGTGKYFEPGDRYTTNLNTFYTIYSNFNSPVGDTDGFDSVRGGDSIIEGRSALEEVKESASTDCNPEGTTDPATCFKPGNEFFWGWDVTNTDRHIRSGWYHDFSGSGEREVADASWISLTSRLMFSSLTPKAANETGVCGSKGGDSRVYTFDMISGRGFRKVSQVGMLAQPLVFFDEPRETPADSTGRRLRISPVMSGQFGADGSSVDKVETVVVPYGRLSWRRIDNFQELKNEEVK